MNQVIIGFFEEMDKEAFRPVVPTKPIEPVQVKAAPLPKAMPGASPTAPRAPVPPAVSGPASPNYKAPPPPKTPAPKASAPAPVAAKGMK